MENLLQPCPFCYHALSERSKECARLWHLVCQNTYQENPFCCLEPCGLYPLSQFESDISFLEKEGFIVTHEDLSPILRAMVLGIDPDSNSVCIRKHSVEAKQKIR